MAKQASGVNKSDEVRQLLKANPKLKAKAVVATLAEKGVEVTEALVYFVKGKTKGRKARNQNTINKVSRITEGTATPDALETIVKIKRLAAEVGGMKKLTAIIEALNA